VEPLTGRFLALPAKIRPGACTIKTLWIHNIKTPQ
jgi:hypothetical protein